MADDEVEIEEPASEEGEDDGPAAGELHRVAFRLLKNPPEPIRLDVYLTRRMPELSRADVQRLIAGGLLTLNGRPAKASYKVKREDRVEMFLSNRLAGKPEPQDIPLDVLYEDDRLIVLNKQAGLIVHPGRGKENWSGTLTNALQFRFEKLSGLGGEARPGIVHRLDRDTTGVIVAAKDDAAHRELGMQFETRRVTKEYAALCYNEIARDADFIRRRIGPHPAVREKMAIRDDERVGKPATTFYQVAERFREFTFVALKPETGRTHQLRVHLESIHAPIVADKAYSGRSFLRLSDLTNDLPGGLDEMLIERQALHARKLRFRHPGTDKLMEFEAPLPEDMQRTLSALRRWRGKT